MCNGNFDQYCVILLKSHRRKELAEFSETPAKIHLKCPITNESFETQAYVPRKLCGSKKMAKYLSSIILATEFSYRFNKHSNLCAYENIERKFLVSFLVL